MEQSKAKNGKFYAEHHCIASTEVNREIRGDWIYPRSRNVYPHIIEMGLVLATILVFRRVNSGRSLSGCSSAQIVEGQSRKFLDFNQVYISVMKMLKQNY
jgi:hypothetical protein